MSHSKTVCELPADYKFRSAKEKAKILVAVCEYNRWSKCKIAKALLYEGGGTRNINFVLNGKKGNNDDRVKSLERALFNEGLIVDADSSPAAQRRCFRTDLRRVADQLEKEDVHNKSALLHSCLAAAAAAETITVETSTTATTASSPNAVTSSSTAAPIVTEAKAVTATKKSEPPASATAIGNDISQPKFKIAVTALTISNDIDGNGCKTKVKTRNLASLANFIVSRVGADFHTFTEVTPATLEAFATLLGGKYVLYPSTYNSSSGHYHNVIAVRASIARFVVGLDEIVVNDLPEDERRTFYIPVLRFSFGSLCLVHLPGNTGKKTTRKYRAKQARHVTNAIMRAFPDDHTLLIVGDMNLNQVPSRSNELSVEGLRDELVKKQVTLTRAGNKKGTKKTGDGEYAFMTRGCTVESLETLLHPSETRWSDHESTGIIVVSLGCDASSESTNTDTSTASFQQHTSPPTTETRPKTAAPKNPWNDFQAQYAKLYPQSTMEERRKAYYEFKLKNQ